MVGRRVSYLGGQSKNFFKEGASKNVATKCFLEHAVKPVNNTLYDKKNWMFHSVLHSKVKVSDVRSLKSKTYIPISFSCSSKVSFIIKEL